MGKTAWGLVVAMIMTTIPAGVNSFGVRAQTIPASTSLVHDSSVTTNTRGAPLQWNRGLSAGKTALAAVPLPGQFAAAAVLPTCLGFWRTGYAVSYGYGGSMLASALVQLAPFLRDGAKGALRPMHIHAAIYAFYGARLCAFLFHRATRSEQMGMKKKDATLVERLKRLPLLLAISGLYYCMAAAPMKIMKLAEPSPLINGLHGMGFLGFFLAAVADWYKSYIKVRDGPDKLVTTGPFKYLRHPNYTGEMIGWTFVCLLAPICNVGSLAQKWPLVSASVVGWAGIVFATLAGEATAGLEKKQKEKYGGTPEYEAWIKTSWAGPMIGGKD